LACTVLVVRRMAAIRHNLGEQLAWLGSCQSWGDAFGTRLDANVLQQKVLPPDPLPQLSVATHWEPLWRRAHEGKLHGGDVVEKRRAQRAGPAAAANRQQQQQPRAPQTQQLDLEDLASSIHFAAPPIQGSQMAAVRPMARGSAPPRPHVAMQYDVAAAPIATMQPSAGMMQSPAALHSGPRPHVALAVSAMHQPAMLQNTASGPSMVAGAPTGAQNGLQVLDSFAYTPSHASTDALAQELRVWRKTMADNTGKKPYTILTNRALDDIAKVLPTTAAALIAIHGVGQKKVEELGAPILAMCQRYSLTSLQSQGPAQQVQAGAQQWQQSAASSASWQGQLSTSRPLATPQMANGSAHLASNSFSAPAGQIPPADSGWLEPPTKRLKKNLAAAATAVGPPSPPVPPSIIELAMLTDEQRAAVERAMRGENMFITGPAGTGKSFLLRYILQEFEKREPLSAAVTAPTGLAAVNIGGQTVHSFAGIGLWQTCGDIERDKHMMAGRIKKKRSFDCSLATNTHTGH